MQYKVGIFCASVFLLTACSTTSPGASPLPTAQPHASAMSQGHNISLETFKVPSPQPTLTPAPTGMVDFGSAALDWDDVDVYALRGCSTISTSCRSEITQATTVELGDPTDTTILPGSRAYICNGNQACRFSGFSAYNGQVPMPVFIPSASCQDQFRACITNPQALRAQYPEIFNTECDISDGICADPNSQQAHAWWHN